MFELERLGWEAWVATKRVLAGQVPDFPSASRVLTPRRRDRVAARLRRNEGDGFWWLDQPIKTVRPAVIHAHFGWAAREDVAAAERNGIPLVAGFHGYDATVYPRYGFDAHDKPTNEGPTAVGVYDELFRNAHCILATSELVAETTPMRYWPRLEAIREIRAEWPARARSGRLWVEGAFDWRKLAPLIDAAYLRATSMRNGVIP